MIGSTNIQVKGHLVRKESRGKQEAQQMLR